MRTNSRKDYNRHTQTDAFSFFKAIDNFDFLCNLVLTYKVLTLALIVTQLLQDKKNDVADGLQMIQAVLNEVRNKRSNVEAFHDNCFQDVVKLANRLNIPVDKPRTNRRQIYRDNHSASSISDFYRVSLTIPLLDTLEQELNARFNEDTLACYCGVNLLPSKILKNHNSENYKSLREHCKDLIDLYWTDLPSPSRIWEELDLWENFWLSEKDICPNNFSDTLKAVDFGGFENVKELLKILATLPLTLVNVSVVFPE